MKMNTELRRIQKILKVLRQAGVTAAQQQEVFLVIMAQEGLQQYDIGKFIEVNSATTSKNIRGLRDKGFVDILPKGKGTSCILTAKGWELKIEILRELKFHKMS